MPKMPTKGTKKIQLYAIAAFDLFSKCFKKAGLLDRNGILKKDKWSLKLRDTLAIAMADTEIKSEIDAYYHNYLRDIYNKIIIAVEHGNPKRKTGYNLTRIAPLLMYAGINDYQELNKTADDYVKKPESISNDKTEAQSEQPLPASGLAVLYTPKKFSRFTLLRTPDSGFIHTYPNSDIVYEGDISLYLKAESIKKHNHYCYARH